jgi:hypothetical protein
LNNIHDKSSSFQRPDISTPRFAGTHHPDRATELLAEQARARVLAEIDRLDLHKYVHELDLNGYTVIPPERVAPAHFIDELREAVVDATYKAEGNDIDIRPDRINTETSVFGQTKFGANLLGFGRVFEQALMNETSLALVTYLLGESCTLQSMMSIIKGPGAEYMGLHTDQNQLSTPAPFPTIAQIANATWALTDYTQDDGATAFVPGSHRFCRHPNSSEATDVALFKPVNAPAGSIILWHGNTWHGAFPRVNPGLRICLITQFSRWYHSPLQPYVQMLPAEAFTRNPHRFSLLTGKIPIALTPQGRVANITPFG